MGSVIEVINSKNENENQSKSAQNWSLFCSITTFLVTLTIVSMHLHPIASILIVGTKIEGGITILLSIFWVATVSVVTDSRRGLAVDEFGAVANGNLYYFSWAGFLCSITLLVNYLRHVFHVDVAGELRSRSARLTTWSGLLATSLVVMGSSANFYDAMCGGDDDTGKCSRAVFGIVLGAMATLAALAIVGMKIATANAPFLVEAGMAFMLVTLFGFGVAFITSEKGPGAPLGNLYYFTWGSFFLSFMILTSCFEDYNAASRNGVENSSSRNHVNGDDTINAMNEHDGTPNHTMVDSLDSQI